MNRHNPSITQLVFTWLISVLTFGFGCNKVSVNVSDEPTQTIDNYKVKGVGGVFYKTEDPEASRDWYKLHLGLKTNEYGSLFEFRDASDSTQKAYLQWSPFDAKTDYFDPSSREFMINFRVGDIERLVEELRSKGITILDSIVEYPPYGKFVHILDLDSVKIELWEPDNNKFTEEFEGETTK